MRKKVVSIGHFLPKLFSSVTAIFSFVKSDQEQLHVLIALKIRENRTDPNELDELKYTKSLSQKTSFAH